MENATKSIPSELFGANRLTRIPPAEAIRRCAPAFGQK
jgi:hypothetical protein